MTYNYIDDQTEYRDLSDQIAILREEINEIPLRVAVPEITYGVPGSGSGGGGGSGDGTLQNYATQAWVEAQNYVTDAWLATEKYVTEAWITLQDFATKAWVDAQNYVTDAWLATEKYVTEAWLATEKYITEAWIATEKYVTEAWLATEKYITEAWIATEKYVTEAWLATEKYITEAWIALQDYVTQAWVDAQNYVTDAWLATEKYITEAWVATQKFVTEAWLATEKYITEAWLATEKYITEAWVATQKYVTEAWLATEKYITEAWIATEKYITEAWVATQEFATKAWIGIQGFAKNAYNTAAAVVGGFAALFGITVPASDTDVEAADKVFVRKTPKTGGGDVDIGTFDLIRVDRVFFESNDGVDLTHSTPHITGKDNAFSIYVPSTKYIDVYCGSAKAASVYKTVTKIFGALSVTGGEPTVVANGHMWLDGKELYVRSGDADYNLTNIGSGGGGSGGWVGTATSSLDMKDYTLKNVDTLYFEKSATIFGIPGDDQYLEGDSKALNYYASRHNFYVAGDRAFSASALYITANKALKLSGSEPILLLGGEMWKSGTDVYVRSGGVSRNMSDIGSGSSTWVATATSALNMDNNDINAVDKLYFRRTNGLRNPYLTAVGEEIFAYIAGVKTAITGGGGGSGSSTWVNSATSDLDMNNNDIDDVDKLYFRKTSGSRDPYLTAVGDEIFAYIGGVKTAITGGGGSGSSSWVATATSNLDMKQYDVKDVDKLYFQKSGAHFGGSAYDQYLEGDSLGLDYNARIHEFYAGGSRALTIYDDNIHCRKALYIDGSERSSGASNGDIWISGSNVMIRSGGKDVNITNL